MTGGYLHHQYEMDENEIAACAYWKSENVLIDGMALSGDGFFYHVIF